MTIAAVPPSLQPSPLAQQDKGWTSSSSRDGESFQDLLAAMLSQIDGSDIGAGSAATPPLSGVDSSLAPAGDKNFEDWRQASPRALASTTGPSGVAASEMRLPPQLAEIFNEHGFFQKAPQAPVTQAEVEVANGPSSRMPRGAGSASAVAGSAGAISAAALSGGGSECEAALAPAPLRTRPHTPRGGAYAVGLQSGGPQSGGPAASSAIAGRAQRTTAAAAATKTARPDRSPRAVRSARAQGEARASDVQLVLAAAGAEASLAARVNALTREERARLRTEIVQLLARHGFTAGAIRLNGEAEPSGRS